MITIQKNCLRDVQKNSSLNSLTESSYTKVKHFCKYYLSSKGVHCLTVDFNSKEKKSQGSTKWLRSSSYFHPVLFHR